MLHYYSCVTINVVLFSDNKRKYKNCNNKRKKKTRKRNCNNKIVNIVTIKEKFMTSFSFHTPPSQKACPLTFLDLKKNEVKVYILCSLFPRTYAAI